MEFFAFFINFRGSGHKNIKYYKTWRSGLNHRYSNLRGGSRAFDENLFCFLSENYCPKKVKLPFYALTFKILSWYNS